MRILFLHGLDVFFLVFHTVFTLFNLTGWAFKKTRRLHLLTTGATAFSWFVIGIFYGWGYCFCTDWHWQVRQALGNPPQSYSYIHFLVLELTGINLPQGYVDHVVLGTFVICVVLSVVLNARDHMKL